MVGVVINGGEADLGQSMMHLARGWESGGKEVRCGRLGNLDRVCWMSVKR